MRGRYLWQKLELLLSFFLLAPLWSALAWLLHQVGRSPTACSCARSSETHPMSLPRQVPAAFAANALDEPNDCLLPSKLAAQLGLAAPPPPPLAGGAGCTPRSGSKPDVSFKAVGAAAQAACKWRRAARGELGADESLMHDACTVIERRTMSRCADGLMQGSVGCDC